ncbi:MAG: hypothetical protein ABR975_01600 [Vulcanimicrobiaceae bacterium]|jgi:hypothetical protein
MTAHHWPELEHLQAMTDDVGLFQHATLDVPNRAYGYCTDDVARALIVACDAADFTPDDTAVAELVRVYLAFLHDARLPGGNFHGFMGYDRRWQDRAGTGDQVGRALWGLGYAEGHAPRTTWRTLAHRLRVHALEALPTLVHLRSRAYAVLGLAHALGAQPADEAAVRAQLDALAATIADDFDRHRADGWTWCEDTMTYDNGRIPEALLRAGSALGNARYREAGLAMLRFYAEAVIVADRFEPVGNDGWYPRGGVKAQFGQQPLEACALVEAAFVACDVSGERRWRDVAAIAHEWFLGGNVHSLVLASEGGCADGLDAGGINPNRGAESTLSWLASAMTMAKRSSPALRAVR